MLGGALTPEAAIAMVFGIGHWHIHVAADGIDDRVNIMALDGIVRNQVVDVLAGRSGRMRSFPGEHYSRKRDKGNEEHRACVLSCWMRQPGLHDALLYIRRCISPNDAFRNGLLGNLSILRELLIIAATHHCMPIRVGLITKFTYKSA